MGIFEEFFSWQGRLNRLPHFIRGIILGVPLQILIAVVKIYRSGFSIPMNFIMATILFAAAALLFIQTIKRCHDINISGWYTLICLIPLINLIFAIYLTFKKGTKGNNRFGEDPLTRTNR